MRESKYDKNKQLQALIDHIREKTQDSSWISINSKDAADILGTGTTHASIVLRDVRTHPDIEAMTDDTTGNRLNKRAQKFRFKPDHYPKAEVPAVEPAAIVEKDKEIVKVEKPKMDKDFKNLYEAEAEFALSEFRNHGYSRENILNLMKILNVLATLGAREGFILHYIPKTSDLLVLKATQVRTYLEVLSQHHLVEFNDNHAKVRLTIGKKPELKETKIEDAVITEPVYEQAPKIADIIPKKEPGKVGFVETTVKEETENNDNAIFEMLVNNLKDFQGFMGGFQEFMAQSLKDIQGKQNSGEVEILKKQLEAGNAAFNKCIAENTNLKNIIAEKEAENKKLRILMAAQKNQINAIYEAMNERFEGVIAEITTAVADFNRMPEWKKIMPAEKAKFQNGIVNAITEATKEILNHKTETVV